MNSRTVFTAVSATGNAVWLAGQTVQQYQVGSNGAIRMGADANGRIYGSAEVAQGDAAHRLGRPRRPCDSRPTWRRCRSAPSTPKLALRTACAQPATPPFGTLQSSGNYNANNDPKLQYDNPLTGTAPPTRWRSNCRSWRA
jgi:hypothetical protein